MAFGRVIEISAGPQGEDGVKITDLHINFEVEKDDKIASNKATVKIYNLTRNTSDKMGKAGNHLIIRAGYKDESVAGLFFGDITTAVYSRDGADTCLTMEALDGVKDLQSKTIAVSSAANATVLSVAKQIIDVLAFPVRGMGAIDAGAVYPTGYSFIGKAKDALTEVLRRLGLIWSVQNETLYIFADGTAADTTGLLLTAKTGLLRSPEPLQDNSQTPAKTASASAPAKPAIAPGRWVLKALLFPQIVPGAMVQVQSATVNGNLKIQKAKFTGDNLDGDFQVEAEAVEV